MNLDNGDLLIFSPHRVFGRMLFDTGFCRLVQTAMARPKYAAVERLHEWVAFATDERVRDFPLS